MAKTSYLDRITLAPILQKAFQRYIRVQEHNAKENKYPNTLRAKIYLNLLKLQEGVLEELAKLRKELIDGNCEEYLKDIEVKVVAVPAKESEDGESKSSPYLNVSVFSDKDMAEANKQIDRRNKALLNRNHR